MGKKRAQAAVLGDLAALAEASPAVRQVRADLIPQDSIRLLCGCSRAILKGDVTLLKGQREDLQPYRKDLRKLASPSTSLKSKRNILKKRKGVLQALVKKAKK